jgi:NTE family protein
LIVWPERAPDPSWARSIARAGASTAFVKAQAIRWRQLASPVWPSCGLVSFDKLERWLIAKLGDITFADLKIPYAAVATDLRTYEPVALRAGRLAPAVRASCSFPGLVTPVELNGRLLCDGFVSNNVPVSAVRARGALGYAIAGVEIMAQKAGQGYHTADCLISPDLAGVSYLRLDYHRLVALGERAAEEKLPTILGAVRGV